MAANGFYRVYPKSVISGLPLIVLLEDGRWRGSDGAYVYTGNYTDCEGKIEATIKARALNPFANSVFGISAQSLDLNMSGKFTSAGFELSGVAPEPSGQTITLIGVWMSEIVI